VKTGRWGRHWGAASPALVLQLLKMKAGTKRISGNQVNIDSLYLLRFNPRVMF